MIINFLGLHGDIRFLGGMTTLRRSKVSGEKADV